MEDKISSSEGFQRGGKVAVQIGNLTPKGTKADKMTQKEILEESVKKIWGKGGPAAEKLEADKIAQEKYRKAQDKNRNNNLNKLKEINKDGENK